MKKKFPPPHRAVWAILLSIGLLAARPASAQVSLETSAGISTNVSGGLQIVLDGNWTNNGTLNAGSGAITFNGSGTQTLFNAAGVFNHLNLNKPGGEVMLLSNINVAGTLSLTGGDVALNGQTITLEVSALLSETPGNTVQGAAGHIETTRELFMPGFENVGGLGFVINSSANLGSTRIVRGHAAQSGNGNQSILRYFEVSPANNAGLNATVAFLYDDFELNGNNEAALRLFRSPDAGANWESVGGQVDDVFNNVTQSGINDFSRWTVASFCIETINHVTANAGPDRSVYLNQSTQLGGSPTASGGAAPYSYSWSPNDGSLDDASAENPTASPASTTIYTLVVTDANGCTSTDEVTVEAIPVKAQVFVANTKLTLEETKQTPSAGDIHSNGTLLIENGEPSTYNSNLAAIGKITIGSDNTINGNVRSQTSISNSGTINGTTTIGPVKNEPFLSLTYSAGGANKTVPKGKSLSLAPGSYGITTMSNNGTLKLTSGEYFFNELRYSSSIEGGVIEINLSSGAPVVINVVTNLQIGHEAAIRLLPNGEADSKLVTFNTKQTTAANWGREAYLLGSFNAPNANVTLVKNSQLRGTICAKEIFVSNDCLFLHHDSPGSLPGPGNLPKSASDDDEQQETSNEQPVTSYQLEQNYPNPFNPSTTISFALPEASEVSLSIYNMSGQLVKKLVAGEMNAGHHNFTWDATNARGVRVASGVYLYVIKAGEFTARKKLVLMK
jgi:hypothetical protein